MPKYAKYLIMLNIAAILVCVWFIFGRDKGKDIMSQLPATIERTTNNGSNELGNIENIYPMKTGFSWEYNGADKFGYTMVLDKIEKDDSKTIIHMKGVLSENQMEFTETVIIDKESITDTFSGIDQSINSIIPNKIVIKAPFVRGPAWEEEFTYNEKTYKAVNEISDITKDDKGRLVYKIDTKVENIEGYPDNTYTEQRILVEGKGLVSFTNTLPDGTDNSLPFGYGLSKDTDEIISEK